jgi:hypothetical protein
MEQSNKNIRFEEKIPLRGIFEMRVYKSGKLIDEITDSNLIVDIAREQMAHLVAGETSGRHIASIAFGTSNVDPLPSDTVLTGQWSRAISSHTFPSGGKVRFDWQLGVMENNGMAIREFGLLTADGKLFARKTRTNPINKEADISVEGNWTIIF